jgi:hypothetical protein
VNSELIVMTRIITVQEKGFPKESLTVTDTDFQGAIEVPATIKGFHSMHRLVSGHLPTLIKLCVNVN